MLLFKRSRKLDLMTRRDRIISRGSSGDFFIVDADVGLAGKLSEKEGI